VYTAHCVSYKIILRIIYTFVANCVSSLTVKIFENRSQFGKRMTGFVNKGKNLFLLKHGVENKAGFNKLDGI